MSFVNPNPNSPAFPFGGGTDNPGGDTSHPGGPSNVAATETGAPPAQPVPIYPPGIPAGHSDTVLPVGMQAVPVTGAGFESGADYGNERAADTGGPDATGREPGQDETVGETETSPGQSPAAFPEPTP